MEVRHQRGLNDVVSMCRSAFIEFLGAMFSCLVPLHHIISFRALAGPFSASTQAHRFDRRAADCDHQCCPDMSFLFWVVSKLALGNTLHYYNVYAKVHARNDVAERFI